MPDDPRAVVIEGLRRLRDGSPCHLCADDYQAALDLVEDEARFEGNMRRYVERNPRLDPVRERSAQIRQANREVLSRMAPAPASPPRPRLGDATEVVRSWREGIQAVRPRPLQLLFGERRGRR